MGAKAIIARSTTKTRIPSIRKPTAALKEKKSYLKKSEFIKIVDSVKANDGFSGNLLNSNDENKPLMKSELINCNVAKNVPITPHKTRTGRVYKRLSTVFAHKLPRHSLLQSSTPLSLKCLKVSTNIQHIPNIVKPLNEPTTLSSNEVIPEVKNVVAKDDTPIFTDLTNVNNFVTEEEINRTIEKIPNLEDIPQPQALISFNSTFNESLDKSINDEEVKVTDEPIVENNVENIEMGNNQSDSSTKFDTGGSGDTVSLLFPDDTNQDVAVPQNFSFTLPILPKLPDLNFDDIYVPPVSTPRKSLAMSPESSPLIPRIDASKIFQNFKGFTPLKFEPTPTSSAEEVPMSSATHENMEFKKLEEETVSEAEPPREKAEEINAGNYCSTEESPECEEEKKNKSTNPPSELQYKNSPPSESLSSTPPSALEESKSVAVVNEPEQLSSNENVPEISNTANDAKIVPIIEVIDLVSEEEVENPRKFSPELRRKNPRRSQRLSLAPNSMKRAQKLHIVNAVNEPAPISADEIVPETSNVTEDDAAISTIPPDDHPHEEEENNSTEMSSESSTRYEPVTKKIRGRSKRLSVPKKFPVKNAVESPQKSPTDPEASTGLEVINGKVYASIKKPKKGKRGIPLSVEVDSTLLVEPKESCIKKAANQSWNGKKHFRWADWTKDNELVNVREFETEEKYGLRKSTKNSRFKDPYDDE